MASAANPGMVSPAGAPASRPGRVRYESLGIWRGIASLGVLLFHSFGRLTPDENIWFAMAPLRHLASFGWLGVHLFFVISGFCIAEKIATLSQGRARAVDFWKNRLLRILPPYWAAILLVLAVNLVTLPFNHAQLANQFPHSWLEAAAHVLIFEPYFGLPTYLLVAWTLTSEIGFYALAGFALVLPRRPASLTVAWCAGALLCLLPLAVPALADHPVAGLWPDFFAGVAVYQTLSAWNHGRRLRGTIGVALIVSLGLLHWFEPVAYGGQIRTIAPCFALLLIGLYSFDRRLVASVAGRGLMAVGIISYSLYLVHAPLVSRGINLGMRWVPASSPVFAVLWLAVMVMAVLFAALFYRVIEQPVEAWRKQHAP